MNFAKFLRTPILQNSSGRLLLKNARCASIFDTHSRKRARSYHLRTNNAINSVPQKTVDGFLDLKLYVKEKLEKSKVKISILLKKNDNCEL